MQPVRRSTTLRSANRYRHASTGFLTNRTAFCNPRNNTPHSIKFLQFARLSEGMSIQEVVFVTVGGLRGSLSLVLAQSAATMASSNTTEVNVKAEIAIYTAGYGARWAGLGLGTHTLTSPQRWYWSVVNLAVCVVATVCG